MDEQQKITALKSIINTGACPINPPLMGWLVETGIITPTGFDIVKALDTIHAMHVCPGHGPYDGDTCPQCELVAELCADWQATGGY